MVTDNGTWIFHYGNSKAAWGKIIHDGRVNYLALNRAARRLLMSNKFQKRVKAKGLVIDLEQFAIA
jgi:hypothetical protein